MLKTTKLPEYLQIICGIFVKGTVAKDINTSAVGTAQVSKISGWDLAEWLKRLAVNAKVATVRSQHPPTQWNLRAADETVLNNVHNKKKIKKIHKKIKKI
jgi:hypothetical protein